MIPAASPLPFGGRRAAPSPPTDFHSTECTCAAQRRVHEVDA